MTAPLIILQNVSKIFPQQQTPAIQTLTTSIPSGKFIGLAGPDGAGKTTLIRLIAGLLKPTTGSITVAGFDSIKEGEAIHHLIGYMPQKFGLYEDLTVQENLNLFADLRGLPLNERKDTFRKLLAFTTLAPFVNRLAGALSGGMKQKLGLACALIRKPLLLLLDEPSVGVDPISRRELWKMVQNLLGEGISVIWSSAYLDEAERCDEVLLLNEGELLFYGKPHELTEQVKERVFKITNIQDNRRHLLGEVLKEDNVIDGLIQGRDIRLITREIISPPIQLDQLSGYSDLKLITVPPRFEDAFINILGGGPKSGSALANLTPQVTSQIDPVIIADGLTKKFGSFTAADRISFEIHKGEIFGLLGPNGAGKSTTFKMLCGLLKPTEGKAWVNGLDLQIAPSEARAQIGYMAQKFSLYGNLSVKQNLEFFSGIYNMSGKAQSDAVNQMIEIFDLQQFVYTSADSLSQGYKQRLALACATMHHPPILFLDEPTSGVDPITRREFWNHINGLVEKGVTVMVTTHFMDEAEYCDRIGLIYQSKMISMGTPDELKNLAKTVDNPNPTLQDAFIKIIEDYNLVGGNVAK